MKLALVIIVKKAIKFYRPNFGKSLTARPNFNFGPIFTVLTVSEENKQFYVVPRNNVSLTRSPNIALHSTSRVKAYASWIIHCGKEGERYCSENCLLLCALCSWSSPDFRVSLPEAQSSKRLFLLRDTSLTHRKRHCQSFWQSLISLGSSSTSHKGFELSFETLRCALYDCTIMLTNESGILSCLLICSPWSKWPIPEPSWIIRPGYRGVTKTCTIIMLLWSGKTSEVPSNWAILLRVAKCVEFCEGLPNLEGNYIDSWDRGRVSSWTLLQRYEAI